MLSRQRMTSQADQKSPPDCPDCRPSAVPTARRNSGAAGVSRLVPTGWATPSAPPPTPPAAGCCRWSPPGCTPPSPDCRPLASASRRSVRSMPPSGTAERPCRAASAAIRPSPGLGPSVSPNPPPSADRDPHHPDVRFPTPAPSPHPPADSRPSGSDPRSVRPMLAGWNTPRASCLLAARTAGVSFRKATKKKRRRMCGAPPLCAPSTRGQKV